MRRSRQHRRARGGFTWIELAVVLVVTIIIGFFAFQWALKNREVSRRVLCAKQLRAIGQAILLYSNDNKGAFPRVRASAGPMRTPVFGTGAAATQPFAADGPEENDVTAALFLLIRTQDITSEVFVCPSSNAVPDQYGGGTNTPQTRSNFTDYRKNLSYSYQNPYLDDLVAIGLKYRGTWGAEYAIAADLNPGTSGARRNVLTPTSTSSAEVMKTANSRNHGRDGQNILYADGHVAWENNVFVGTNRDNIYTRAFRGYVTPWESDKSNPFGSPEQMEDSVLLPTDD